MHFNASQLTDPTGASGTSRRSNQAGSRPGSGMTWRMMMMMLLVMKRSRHEGSPLRMADGQFS